MIKNWQMQGIIILKNPINKLEQFEEHSSSSSKLEQRITTHRSFVQVPQSDVWGVLVLVVAIQYQVTAGVSKSCSVEAQQWHVILKSVKMFLGHHAEHIEVVGKIGAHHHLKNKGVECIWKSVRQLLVMS